MSRIFDTIAPQRKHIDTSTVDQQDGLPLQERAIPGSLNGGNVKCFNNSDHVTVTNLRPLKYQSNIVPVDQMKHSYIEEQACQ